MGVALPAGLEMDKTVAALQTVADKAEDLQVAAVRVEAKAVAADKVADRPAAVVRVEDKVVVDKVAGNAAVDLLKAEGSAYLVPVGKLKMRALWANISIFPTGTCPEGESPKDLVNSSIYDEIPRMRSGYAAFGKTLK